MYATTYYTTTSLDLFFSAIVGFFATYALLCLAAAVLMIVAMWIVFQKAGKPGWASIVPIYNIIVMFQIAGLSPWLVLLMVIPFANFVLGIVVIFRTAKAFGKGVGFGFGLLFLGFIFYPILAFGNAKYEVIE